MTTYTTVADANGDFTVPFSSSYIGGEKITVTAEKDGAEKSIELYAPSEVSGGGTIQFSGTLDNFPNNIGNITLSSEIANFPSNCFNASLAGIFLRSATGLTISGSATSLGASAFIDWKLASTVNLPSSLISIGETCFSGWSELLDLVLPSSLQNIGYRSFYNCQKLRSILVNSNLRNVADEAFSSCPNLAGSVVLPPTLVQVGFLAFAYTKISSLVMSSGAAEQQAFFGCSQLSMIELGAGVTRLEPNCFANCPNLVELKVLAPTPPTLSQAGIIFGTNGNPNVVIKVPSAYLSTYQTATNWSKFASQMVGF